MLPRHLTPTLREAARRFPVVTLTGPRQSGKTTLVRATFPGHAYVSLDLPDERAFAREDPRGFLDRYPGPVILDEVQRVPELLSYIQAAVDEAPDRRGRFILTGSHNFLLRERVSQSLAGRTAVLHLLPLSLSELWRHPPIEPERLGEPPAPGPPPHATDPWAVLHAGFYPAIHDRDVPAPMWLAAYRETYLERDVRQLVQVGDLEAFDRFLRLAAGRNGQLLSLSALAADCGITQPTARRWLGVLEASHLVLRVPAYHTSHRKRLVKAPRLYFLDTGLLCHLLRIDTPEALAQRAERGAVFEAFVVSELHKAYLHAGRASPLHHWRDRQGHEVDLVLDTPRGPLAIEIKSGATVASDFFRGLRFWRRLLGDDGAPAALVYGGGERYFREGVAVHPWHDL